MPDENPEILKNVEEKDPEEQVAPQSTKLFDAKKIFEEIKARFAKLEKIKNYIPLKTYNLIFDRLKKEEKEIQDRLTKKSVEVAKENKPQILPKAFFEESLMKVKSIRIE